MSTDALSFAVVALAGTTLVLSLLCAWLAAQLHRKAKAAQTAQDLLAENLVHAMAELVLRVDDLDRYLRDEGDGAE